MDDGPTTGQELSNRVQIEGVWHGLWVHHWTQLPGSSPIEYQCEGVWHGLWVHHWTQLPGSSPIEYQCEGVWHG